MGDYLSINILRDRIDSYEEEREKLLSDLEMIEAECDELEKKYKIAADQINELQIENRSLRDENKRLHQILDLNEAMDKIEVN